MHEASLHTRNSFVTLTYDSKNLCASLNYRDFQLFMKRLRKAESSSVSTLEQQAVAAFVADSGTEAEADARSREALRELRRVRFVVCGEYGDTYFRPHFHSLLFGKDFPDRYVWRESSSGFTLYRSAELEKLWPYGHCEIGDVTFESAAYVARYCMKKVTGDAASSHYRRLDPYTGDVVDVEPEFLRMSLRPGIGADWIRLYRSDVYRGDGDAYCVVNGMKVKPPRYYDRYMSETEEWDDLVYQRYKKNLLARDDNTPERLAVREQVTRARLSFKKRSLE